MIKAEVVADSKNEFGNRITTMVVTFPRIILAEFNTHRMFSRNSASSRAIPFEKMAESVEENPFIPIAWQKDHKGMQGYEYWDGVTANNVDPLFNSNFKAEELFRGMWAEKGQWERSEGSALYNMIEIAKEYNKYKVTKQLANRLLEPFMWHTVIVTATEWENFFALRCPQYEVYDGDPVPLLYRSKKDVMSSVDFVIMDKFPHNDDSWWRSINKGQAEIHMMALAEAMWDAYNESIPKELKAGEWHIPYEYSINNDNILKVLDFSLEDRLIVDLNLNQLKEFFNTKVKIATVMAARTSYTVVGNDLKPLSYKRMLEIHDEMLAANPKHMSPFEHCAKAMKEDDAFDNAAYEGQHAIYPNAYCGNFRGFIQYRKMIPNENIT